MFLNGPLILESKGPLTERCLRLLPSPGLLHTRVLSSRTSLRPSNLTLGHILLNEWLVLPGGQSLLTCEEGQGGGVNDGELGSRVIPSPLELEEGHRCWRTLDLGQRSRAMGKGMLGKACGVCVGGGR